MTCDMPPVKHWCIGIFLSPKGFSTLRFVQYPQASGVLIKYQTFKKKKNFVGKGAALKRNEKKKINTRQRARFSQPSNSYSNQ